MENFVNREVELQLVAEKFSTLVENSDLVQTPIIEFYGVGGIGKTTVLRRIEQLCHDRSLASIWADASQSVPQVSQEIIQQIQHYNVSFTPKNEDLSEQSIHAARALLAREPLIFLIDSLDAASEEQLGWIEHMLRDLIEGNRLFAILASKRIVSFDQTLVVARRLTTARLKPFDQENCLSFVSKLDQEIEPEIRDIIFAWTHGYPLAVNVMVQAIKESKLDPRKEQDQRQILAIMSEQVINRGVFSRIVQEPDDLAWCQTMLSLFSVPRRCNLSIMQKMVERFAHPYRLGSSLAYMSLPKRINQTTDVLNWNPAKAGFSVEAPIRHMFLVKMKLEESATFTAIHRFLAITNRQLVDEVSGTDRVRYWLEYLYHCAHCEEGTLLLQIVEKTMRQIVAEPVEYLLQFHEDFVSDEELKTVLDVHSNMILSLIYRQFAIINKQSAMEAKETERVFYLQEFFYYVILDPVIIDLSLFLKETVQQIVKEESAHICFKLYEALLRDTRIKEKLGESIVVFSSLLGASSQGG